ncbi:DUF4012 domain-containing protein [Patescibacteria group bacterium]|nr:DUF4012 domain-containing protein [Patescibacteria group bacterium]
MIDLVNKKGEQKTKKAIGPRASGRFYKKRWFIITICVVGLLIIIGILSYLPGKRAYQYAMQGKDKIISAQTSLGEQDLEEASSLISEGLASFKAAEENLNKLTPLKYFPILGRQLRAVDDLLSAGVAFGEAADQIAQLGLEIFNMAQQDGEINFAEVSVEQKEQILSKLVEATPILESSGEKILGATDKIENIPTFGLMPQIHSATQLMKEKIGPIKDTVTNSIPLVKILPGVFGHPEAKTYLFLLQNNTELRPTGGFIGTYGIVTLNSAEIETFWTDNIYNLDEKIKDSLIIEPPWQLASYLNATQWYMRDSNWSPDFPTSAEKAMWFYQQEGGQEELEGVISVTPTFIESLIALVGDITIHGITFNKDNFVDTLQYQVEQGYYQQGISDSERKEVIGDLAKVLMDRILALPQDKYTDLWSTFSKDVTEKQILLYMEDQSAQDIILEQNWGGKVIETNNDYLMVVDANMASLKSDPVVNRTIYYEITKVDNDYQAKVTINYDHTADFDWKTTRYRTYTRVYVPKGSKLIDSSGSMQNDRSNQEGDIEQSEELGKTVFGAFISIEPKESKNLTFTYKLPDFVAENIDNNRYTLTVQKQSGTISHGLNMNLDFGKKIDSFHPLDKGSKPDDNKVQFVTDLTVDRSFAINF